MGKGNKIKENSKDTPKRRLSSDGISPTSIQESKQVRVTMGENEKMASIEKKLEKLGMLDTVLEKLEKLDELLALQHQHSAQLNNLESRVDDLEVNLEEIRENQHQAVSREEFEGIKKKNHSLEQALLNDRLIIMNLPLIIGEDKDLLNTTVNKIMKALNVTVSDSQYEAFTGKSRDRKSATVTMKFSSSLLKTRVVKNFRTVKKSIADVCPLLVENLIALPADHYLNGKRIMIANKLTQHNMQLLNQARTKVPSHFTFVYDTPESIIKAKIGDFFHKIESEDDIARLMNEVDNSRGAVKKTAAKKSTVTPRATTRSQKSN